MATGRAEDRQETFGGQVLHQESRHHNPSAPVYLLKVDQLGVSLCYATAQVHKEQRGSGREDQQSS